MRAICFSRQSDNCLNHSTNYLNQLCRVTDCLQKNPCRRFMSVMNQLESVAYHGNSPSKQPSYISGTQDEGRLFLPRCTKRSATV